MNIDKDISLLALETSGDVCGVAVWKEGRLCVAHTFRHAMHLSERLLDIVEASLTECGLTREDVGALAVSVGPGSFTGTRIGAMTAKTLATVWEKPLYGVGCLDALAAEYLGLQETVVTPILPCRTGVVFASAFRVDGETPEALTEPAALTIPELASQTLALGEKRLLFCGAAATRYRVEIQAALAESDCVLSFGLAEFPRVALVARLTYRRIAAGDPGDDPIGLVPLYIAPPPITQPKTPLPS